MRPANQQQAIQHMEHLLNRKLKGNRSTRVKEHIQRAKKIATVIWERFQVGAYQYQLKHLRWYLDTHTQHLKPETRYRHWLTVKNILQALGKEADWTRPLHWDREFDLKNLYSHRHLIKYCVPRISI